MNIIDILVLLVLAFSLFAGMYKGFIASGLSLLGLVGSWFDALRLYPTVARLVLENQTLMGVLSNYLEPATFFEDMAISGVSAQTSVSELVARGGVVPSGFMAFLICPESSPYTSRKEMAPSTALFSWPRGLRMAVIFAAQGVMKKQPISLGSTPFSRANSLRACDAATSMGERTSTMLSINSGKRV